MINSHTPKHGSCQLGKVARARVAVLLNALPSTLPSVFWHGLGNAEILLFFPVGPLPLHNGINTLAPLS